MMRQRKMSDAEAIWSIRPANRSDRRALLVLAGLVLLVVVCGGGLYYNNYRQQIIREQGWTSAVATIEDARTQVAMRVESQVGGAMLYEVEVLAKYSANGVERKQWTTIHQHPQPLADAQLQILRLKKQQCFVRWDPAEPDHIIAETN